MSFDELFQNGVKSYQAKEFVQASTYFTQALDLEPANTTALVNLALAQYQAGQKIAAFAYYKKALSLDPDFSTAQQGLDFVKSQVQVREIPHRIENYERMRTYFISPFSVAIPLILAAVVFTVWGFRTVKHLGHKKQAYLAGEDASSYGIFNLILSVLLTFSFLWIAFFKYDAGIKRGMIKVDSAAVRSAPGVTSPEILQIYGGLEVRILRNQDGWLQIEYPGSIAGWVESGSVVEF